MAIILRLAFFLEGSLTLLLQLLRGAVAGIGFALTEQSLYMLTVDG
jgi:RsiW-degrading membrane proteinase PrsW (M82 family)